jgi:tripartite-type tricarboxylate transporter receptor subunit TctC
MMMTGVNVVHVPYRGAAPALTDVLAGQVQAIFDNLPTSLEHINAGKVRPLAVTTAARAQMLPDLPTVGEFLPGYEVSSWLGIGVPKRTPAELIDSLNRQVNAAIADPRIKARIAELSSVPLPTTPAGFGDLIASETEKWAKVVKAANLKPD